MALSLREHEFINTARFSGSNTLEILLQEIFPYGYACLIVGFINSILFVINTEAALAVIGLSNVETPTLGSIIFWALNYNAMLIGQVHVDCGAGGDYRAALPRLVPDFDRL